MVLVVGVRVATRLTGSGAGEGRERRGLRQLLEGGDRGRVLTIVHDRSL